MTWWRRRRSTHHQCARKITPDVMCTCVYLCVCVCVCVCYMPQRVLPRRRLWGAVDDPSHRHRPQHSASPIAHHPTTGRDTGLPQLWHDCWLQHCRHFITIMSVLIWIFVTRFITILSIAPSSPHAVLSVRVCRHPPGLQVVLHTASTSRASR